MGPEIVDDHNDIEDKSLPDPFETHFADPDNNDLSKRLKAINNGEWISEVITTPELRLTSSHPTSKRLKIDRKSITSIKDLNLKFRLEESASKTIAALEPLRTTLAPEIFNYGDLLFTDRTPENAQGLRDLVCLHALNHVYKTGDRVKKNNERLSRDQHHGDGLDVRDQGFTRPKVLFLLPTRNSCVRYMASINKFCPSNEQEDKKRFQAAFAAHERAMSDEKPSDYQELFDGNPDENFKLGVQVKGKTLKYYSQFYRSDMIFASPLGLKLAMKSKDNKKSDYDFLSSIEVLVIDQADALLMQNWDHVNDILARLNLQPRESHDCDFSRIRSWYLDRNSKHLRQTIVLSAYLTPELNGLFSTHMSNVAGKVKAQKQHLGSMLDIKLSMRQTFNRIDSISAVADPDERFKYFASTVIPSIARLPAPSSGGPGVLIFIPSFFDFLRVENFFKTSTAAQNLSYGALSEKLDNNESEVNRTRSHFLTGRYSVLLYTGRMHHYWRYQLRGVKKVFMYSLPDNPRFYNEIAGGYLQSSIEDEKLFPDEAKVRVLFSKWEALSLERIVGTKQMGKMLREREGDTFDFK